MSISLSDPKPARRAVFCPNKKCKMPFDGLFIETMLGVEQLRGATFVVRHAELFCTRCGRKFYWGKSERERDSDMQLYCQLLAELHGPAKNSDAAEDV